MKIKNIICKFSLMNVNKKRVWYLSLLVLFLKKSFKFKPHVHSRCHDLLLSTNFSSIAVSNIKNADYCCSITGISKSEAIELLQIINLTEKGKTLISRETWCYKFTRNSNLIKKWKISKKI